MKAVEIIIPPDKSISHRAIMLASVSEGATRIKNLLMAEDIKRTIEAFRAMGVSIKKVKGKGWRVNGVGMRGLRKPSMKIYLGNSGTTMRILPGILAGQDFEVILTGDKSLSSRPMGRVAEPLIKMGATIEGQGSTPNHELRSETGHGVKGEVYPPLKICGGKLKSINYKSKIASAQVKSCILFAGLYADGVTSVSEPEKSRDHTERMLSMFGCRVQGAGCKISLKGQVKLKSPGIIEIPGDISSAAFFMVAGCILPDIKIKIKNVGLNSTRAGILDILKRMGADINLFFSTSLEEYRSSEARGRVENNKFLEPAGDIIVKSSKLKGVTISPKEVVRAIDEIPVIMVAACFAKGKTIIKGIEELRVKETDRIKSMITNLRKIGADIDVFFSTRSARSKNIVRAKRQRREVENNIDGRSYIVINGGKLLHGARVSSFGDHRTAMSMLVAGLGTKGKVMVTGLDCINKSFPGFEILLRLTTSA